MMWLLQFFRQALPLFVAGIVLDWLRPLRPNHCFKLKSVSAVSATWNSFKHSFFIRINDEWINLPVPKEIAEAENLIIF